MKSKTQRMRALIRDPKICVSPGVYDGYSIHYAAGSSDSSKSHATPSKAQKEVER